MRKIVVMVVLAALVGLELLSRGRSWRPARAPTVVDMSDARSACVYVYVYVYVYVCVPVFAYVCRFLCTVCMRMCMYVCVCMRTCMNMEMYTCVCVFYMFVVNVFVDLSLDFHAFLF